MSQHQHFRTKIIFMWVIATLFSYLQFFLQIVNNAITDDLIRDFNISPVQVGILSSAFFYPFIAMQIPVGYFLNKYSVKKVLGLSAFICSVGTLAFSLSHNFYWALFFRALAGFGAGFGFLGMLTVTRTWFAPRYFSMMVGLSEFIAMLATALSEKILVQLVAIFDWRQAIFYVGILGLLITLLIFIFIQDKVHDSSIEPTHFLEQLAQVLKTPACWKASIFGCGMFSVVTAFSALWGFKFLSVLYQYTPSEAGNGVSTVFVGLALGCPIIGFLVAKFHQKLLFMGWGSLFSLIITFILIFPIGVYQHGFVLVLLCLLGFVCGTYYLSYEVAASHVDMQYKSMAMAFCSMFVMVGAILLQPAMGLVMEALGYVDHQDIVNPIASHAMQMSMLLLLLVQTVALIMVLWLRKSNAKN